MVRSTLCVVVPGEFLRFRGLEVVPVTPTNWPRFWRSWWSPCRRGHSAVLRWVVLAWVCRLPSTRFRLCLRVPTRRRPRPLAWYVSRPTHFHSSIASVVSANVGPTDSSKPVPPFTYEHAVILRRCHCYRGPRQEHPRSQGHGLSRNEMDPSLIFVGFGALLSRSSENP